MNKMLKKLISKATMICLGATVFSGIITPMAANASERDIPKNIKVHKEAPLDYSPLISPLDKKTKVRYIDKLVDNQGDLVFCLQHEKDSPSKGGVEYKVGNKLDSGLNWIIKNFYTGKEYLTGNKNLDYYITSKAIHVYTGQSMLIDGKKPIDPKHVLPKINSIVEKAKKIKSDDIGKIDAKITLKSIGEKYKFENNKFISPTYTIDKTGNGTIGNIKLEVSNSKAKIFVNGKETSSIKAGEKFTIEIPENEVKDNEKIKVTAKTTVTNDYDYSISYSPIGNSKVQKVGKYVKGIVNTKDLETEATAPVKGMGKIQILKVDEETEAKLEVAEFQVKDKTTGKVLETLTTNKEGIAVSNWYPVGTELVIKETKAPGKYILNEKEYTATINSNMQTIEIKVPNKIMKGRVQILKVDEETGAKLEGAKFELKDKTTGKVLETLTTNKEGIVVSNWYPVGTELVIKEVKAPAKYTLNGKEYFATITENMKTIEITVPNKIIKGRIQILKVDEETGAKLEGAKFELKDKITGKVLETLTTNKEGIAVSNWYPVGTELVIKETKAPGKYILNEKEYTATINSNMQTIEIKVPNKIMKGRVQILKVDEETGAKLEGAKFELKDKTTGKVLETLTTNKEGIAVSNWYPVGTELVIKEVKAPAKYTLNGKEYFATITENMKTIEITVPNKIIKGRIQILKVDEETGAKLEGAKFELKDKITGKVLETLTTNKEGVAVSNYYNYGTQIVIKETKAPAKYTLNGKEYFATITENMKTIEIKVPNKIIKGTISIHKIDSLTKKPLQGVEFNVLDSNNKVIEKLVTDKDGNVKTKELNYGEYRILEVKTNKYYNLNEKAIDVSITENKDYSYTVENKPTTGRLLIKKTDIATGKELEGAKIKITCIEGLDKGKVIEFISGKTAKEFELKAGKYTYEETAAPKGYEINKSIGTFEITKEGQIVKCDVKDKATRKPTPKLPHTGYDYGTIAIVGAIILVIAGVVIVSRKKNTKK